MPKAAAVPLSHVRSPETPRTARREAWRAQPIEARISALEARWEETTPTLATIADLRGVENRLIKWVLGAAAGVLLAMIGIFFSGYNALNGRLDSAVSELRTENRSAIADLKEDTRAALTELKAEIRDTNARMDARFERMEARFEKIDAKFEKMDEKFDVMMMELRAQRSDIR